jgi:hypothetical protein
MKRRSRVQESKYTNEIKIYRKKKEKRTHLKINEKPDLASNFTGFLLLPNSFLSLKKFDLHKIVAIKIKASLIDV